MIQQSTRNERGAHEADSNPEDVWAQRPPIAVADRLALRTAFDTELARLQAAEDAQDLPWQDRSNRATLQRRALTGALIQRRYLVIRGCRVCPLNRRRKRSSIS